MVNYLPAMLGPIIMGSHLAVTWLWFTLVTANTTVSHSGYHLPFLPSPVKELLGGKWNNQVKQQVLVKQMTRCGSQMIVEEN